jgi:hypothetical protein
MTRPKCEKFLKKIDKLRNRYKKQYVGVENNFKIFKKGKNLKWSASWMFVGVVPRGVSERLFENFFPKERFIYSYCNLTMLDLYSIKRTLGFRFDFSMGRRVLGIFLSFC